MADSLICSQGISFDYTCNACYDGYHGRFEDLSGNITYNYDITGYATLYVYGPNNPIRVGDELTIKLQINDNHGGSHKVNTDSIKMRLRGGGYGSSYYTVSNAANVSEASNIWITWEDVKCNARYSQISASFSSVSYSSSHGSMESYSGSFDLDLPIAKNDPTASISASNVVAGSNAAVNWSFSDSDGDSVSTVNLVRYYKASGSSSWKTTSLSVSSSTRSYSDAIPSNYVGGQVYYRLGFKDTYSSTLYKESTTYTVAKANVAPTTPGTPTLSSSEIKGGESISISWTASSDTDGNLSGYQLEAQLDGGSWTQIYKGSSRSYNYTVPSETETIAFRVRAYDSSSAYSSYATSTTYAVTNAPDAIYGYANIGGVNKQLTGEGYATIGGVLRPLVKYLICHNSVWKSMLTGTEVVSALPDGYVQLEYIKSSGTQYIDTGFKPNNNTRVLIDYESLATSTAFVFGSRHNSSANSTSYSFSSVILGSNSIRSDFGSVESSITGTVMKRVILDKNKNVTTYDGTSVTATSQTFQSSYPLTLCAVNTAGTKSLYSSLKIYSCQIYDNGTLIRNFIPCMSPDGIAGLYDTSGGTFYPNNGTGEFVAGEPVSMSSYPVPKNFIQTEYIQFIGSQWIDTGLKLPSSYKIELGLTPMASRGIICGVQWSSPKFELCVWENNMGLTTADTAFTGIAITPGSGYYDLICENNAFTINGSTETKTVTKSNSTAYNLLIGAHGSGEIADYHGQIKLYYFRLYDNGKVVRDFIPCINASGVAGLWDKVNGKFYGNSGSGTFVSGQTLIEGYIDITPIMTSNTAPSGYVASASSVNGSAAAYMAFDSMNTTSTSERIWHSAGGMPQWIMMQFPEAVQVDMFTVTNRPDTGNSAAKGITAFSLEGSNNGSTFTSLGAYTSDGAIGKTTQYTVQTPGTYQYYRIHITSAGYVYGSTQYALVDQIRFYRANS